MPRAPTSPGEQDEREQLLKIGWELESVQNRLADGAETFASLKRRLQKLETPKPLQVTKVAAVVIGALAMVFGWVWQAARYPDRAEYSALKTRIADLRERLDVQIETERGINADLRTGAIVRDTEIQALERALRQLKADVAERERRRRR